MILAGHCPKIQIQPVNLNFHHKKSNLGFSLLEVMIGVVILAFMALVLYYSTSGILSSKDQTGRIDDAHHSAQLTLQRMSNDLEMAFLLSNPEFLGTDGKMKTAFIGKEDALNFVSFSPTRYFKDLKEANFGEVGYWLEPNPENNRLKTLMRRESKLIDNEPEQGGVAEPLLENVEELHFEYYDVTKKEWTKSWDSSQLVQSNRLPRAVKISIRLKDIDQEENADSSSDLYFYSTLAEIRIYQGPISF